jgi:hypothetical protein
MSADLTNSVVFTLNGEVQKKVLTIDDVVDYLEDWAEPGDRVELQIITEE